MRFDRFVLHSTINTGILTIMMTRRSTPHIYHKAVPSSCLTGLPKKNPNLNLGITEKARKATATAQDANTVIP